MFLDPIINLELALAAHQSRIRAAAWYRLATDAVDADRSRCWTLEARRELHIG